MSFVYFIESTNGATYIGVTVNLDKRIRQHNKELKEVLLLHPLR